MALLQNYYHVDHHQIPNQVSHNHSFYGPTPAWLKAKEVVYKWRILRSHRSIFVSTFGNRHLRNRTLIERGAQCHLLEANYRCDIVATGYTLVILKLGGFFLKCYFGGLKESIGLG